MWSKKREINDMIIFAIFPMVMNIATNIVYFIGQGSNDALEFVRVFNIFTFISSVICFIFILFNKGEKISQDEKKEISKRMKGFRLLSIVFIAYIGFSVFIVRNLNIIISSVIIFLGYINCYITKIKSSSIGKVSETQRNWRAAYNIPSYDDISFLWRIKPMLLPHVSVSFGERIKNIDWYLTIFIMVFTYPFFIEFHLEFLPFLAVVVIFLGKNIVYILDVIFGIYTETEGICTGVVMKEKTKGGRRIYYEIYVTDFEKKREIKFKQYDYCCYSENDLLKLTHGGLSKKVIATKLVNKKF